MRDFNQTFEAANNSASGQITVDDYSALPGVAASGTIEVLDYLGIGAGDSVTVDGVAYIEGTDFDAETSNEVTATNLAAAINAGAQAASAVGALITVTAAAVGVAGNAIGMSSDVPIYFEFSDDTLAGGVDAATVTVGTDDLVANVDFNTGTDNEAAATNLAAAITALAGVSASAVGNVVTVVYDTPGAGGNAIALESSHEGDGITLSGATLEGGVAEAYSDIFSYDTGENIQEVEEILTIISKTGTLTIDVTPQYSIDKLNWSNGTAFAQKTAAGTETLNRTTTGLFTRYKYVIGGTAPLVNFMIQAVAK